MHPLDRPVWASLSALRQPLSEGNALAMAARIEARDEQPFLHAWQTNQAAIALYESLGFRTRAVVNAVMLQRDATG